MKLIRKSVAPIIWLIVISFVAWGFQSVLVGLRKESQGVGKIFGETVSFKEFQDALRAVELFSANSPTEKAPMEQLEQAAWQHLIFKTEAVRQHINATDEEVRSEIAKQFIEGGSVFNQPLYEQWVQTRLNESPRSFEEKMRDVIRIQKLMAQHQNVPIDISEKEIETLFQNENVKLTVEYVRFDSIEKANDAYESLQNPSEWEKRKKTEPAAIQSTPHLSLDMLSSILSLSQENLDRLAGLADQEISKPLDIGNGYAIFHPVKKEAADKSALTDLKKEELKNRLTEQKKRFTFLDWWRKVMMEANVEKFNAPS